MNQPKKIWILTKLDQFNPHRKKQKIPPGYYQVDCSSVGLFNQLSPDFLYNIADYEGNIAPTLTTFMHYIKVYTRLGHYDGQSVTNCWHRWKLSGFKYPLIKPFFGQPIFSYNGSQLSRLEERQLFKKIYKSKVVREETYKTLVEIHKTHNIVLFDTNVPNMSIVDNKPIFHDTVRPYVVGTGVPFVNDFMIDMVNYSYSHVFALAELLTG